MWIVSNTLDFKFFKKYDHVLKKPEAFKFNKR